MSLAIMNSNEQVKNRKLGAGEAAQGHHHHHGGADMSSAGNKRKLSAYHPTLGYAIPPPQPAKVARRNARERNRVKQVNCGFEVLRTHIPTAVKHKKMSKVDTLRHAVDYIQNLKRLLGEQEDFCSSSDDGDEPKRILRESPDVKRSPLSSIPTPSTPPTPPEQVSPSATTILPSSQTHSSYYGNGMTSSYSQYNPSQQHGTHVQSHHQGHHIPNQVHHPQHHQHYDYESSSYYSSSGVSPPPTAINGSYHYNGSSLPRDGSASPTSPSVYSDYGPCNPPPLVNTPPNSIPSSSYMTSLDDFYNAEEDEILDAIVKWQED